MGRFAGPPSGLDPSRSCQILRFSSADLPPAERLGIWREEFGRKVMNVEVEPVSKNGDTRLDAVSLLMPSAALGRYDSSNVRLSRTRALLADGRTDVHFMFIRSGRASKVSAYGEESGSRGAVLLGWQAEPRIFSTTGRLRTDSIILDYDRLSRALRGRDEGFVKPLPRGHFALKLLGSYIDTVHGAATTPDATLAIKIVDHFYDLAAIALGASSEFVAHANQGSLREARLATMKADILGHLGSSEISATWLALRHDVSPSYVRRIFEPEGMSVSQFVLAERLEKARRLLSEPSSRSRAISAVAYSVGFTDLSYFNRAFKQRFGKTPSEAIES